LSGDLAQIAARAAVALDARQLGQIEQFIDLLMRWNAVYNLTAVRDRPSVLVQHIADCLAAVPPLARRRVTGRLLDVGSGGGLPGVLFAIALPGLQVTCVDAVAKKASFVRQVAGALRLPNLAAEHGRVEALRGEPFDVISARAFSSLAQLVALTRTQLAEGGVWMAMKGKEPADEFDALPEHVEVFHVEHLAVPELNAERCIVWLRPREAR
jgi:16S rRNA (guanine527-N7)-methyltransferase